VWLSHSAASTFRLAQETGRVKFRGFGKQARQAWRTAVDLLVYLVVRLILCVIQTLPMDTCDRLARRGAWLAYDVLRIRRRVADDNLQLAFPEWSQQRREQIARQMWHHLLLMVCELAQLSRKIHETNYPRYVWCRDVAQHVDLLTSSRPVVMVSGHFGNFEVGGVLAGLLGFPTYTIARPLDNPFLHRFITRHRSSKGQYMLPKAGSAQHADRILAEGGTLVLLGDQDAGPKGCWVPFFNRPASCHKAIALFAIAHQAPLVLSYARRLDRPLHFEVGIAGVFDPLEHPLANVRQITAWYNQQLEQLVRAHPEQYWWLHRRWRAEPQGPVRGRRRRTAAGPGTSMQGTGSAGLAETPVPLRPANDAATEHRAAS
jgi:KDO2-lipid IV(A) lauroyltransferase